MKNYVVSADHSTIAIDGQNFKVQKVAITGKPVYYRANISALGCPRNWIRVDINATAPVEFDEGKVGGTAGSTYTRDGSSTPSTNISSIAKLEALLDDNDKATLADLIAKAKAKLETQRAQNQVDRKKASLLKQLADLGFDVSALNN